MKSHVSKLHEKIIILKSKPIFCESCGNIGKLVLSNVEKHRYTGNPNDYHWIHIDCQKDYVKEKTTILLKKINIIRKIDPLPKFQPIQSELKPFYLTEYTTQEEKFTFSNTIYYSDRM